MTQELETVVSTEGTQQGSTNSNDNLLIQESKKYRTRAQSAETELEALKATNAEVERKRLEESGEFKELNINLTSELDTLKADLESANAKADKWNVYQTDKKTALLEKLDEADRETFKSLDLAQLEKVVERTTDNINRVSVNTQRPMGQRATWQNSYEDKADLAARNPKLYKELRDSGSL